MCVSVPRVCRGHRPEEGVTPPGTEVTDDCQPPGVWWCTPEIPVLGRQKWEDGSGSDLLVFTDGEEERGGF